MDDRELLSRRFYIEGELHGGFGDSMKEIVELMNLLVMNFVPGIMLFNISKILNVIMLEHHKASVLWK